MVLRRRAGIGRIDVKNLMRQFAFERTLDRGFTLIELLVVIVMVATLAMLLLPALAGTKPNAQSFQCVENQRQLVLAWQMYAEDNNDLLPPNDYPYLTTYATAGANQSKMKNWVVGTMAQVFDAIDFRTGPAKVNYWIPTPCFHLTLPTGPFTVVRPIITLTLNAKTVHVRSYSMNSAVGTILLPL